MVRDMMLAFMSADSLSVAKAAMTSAVPALPQWEVVGEFRERDGAAHVNLSRRGKTPRRRNWCAHLPPGTGPESGT
jgi:hypothetical protein